MAYRAHIQIFEESREGVRRLGPAALERTQSHLVRAGRKYAATHIGSRQGAPGLWVESPRRDRFVDALIAIKTLNRQTGNYTLEYFATNQPSLDAALKTALVPAQRG